MLTRQVFVSPMAGMPTLQELVAQVATAYFSHVSVSTADIPSVMSAITEGLRAADGPTAEAAEAPAAEPSGPTRGEIERSVTPDALISFEDGRPYKTLRRHLAARGLTPIQYRVKYSLPDDYPMVAPNTSAARSRLARSIGLGGRKRPPPAPAKAPASEPAAVTPARTRPARRPRGAKPTPPRR
jgi:predicted transcriptional regulator